MFIIVRRASTFFGTISITDCDNNRIVLSNTDKLIFTVKKHQDNEDESPVIKKVMIPNRQSEGEYVFELTPEETDLSPGIYYYDVGVQRSNGEFYHIDIPDQFIIKESISRKEING